METNEVDFTKEFNKKNNITKTKTPNKQTDLTAHALKYGIAALSFVSFITTSNGLKNTMPNSDKLTPYLISFCIQVIVLIVGSGLFNLINKIRKKKDRKNHTKSCYCLYNSSLYCGSIFFFIL